jgi:hypothetical protein
MLTAETEASGAAGAGKADGKTAASYFDLKKSSG